VQPLRGAAARTVTNMEASLTVPTATSVRAIAAWISCDASAAGADRQAVPWA
jgi:2-oxoglutarate dehydrogenase E1 component